jgi:acetolactate synthase-1/2/3 large subunit
MLAVTAQIPSATIATLTHQRLHLHSLFAPITKASVSIGESDTGAVVNDGMDLAAASRPGPVHISLASDVAIQECSSVEAAQPSKAGFSSSISAVTDRVAACQRPILLIGLGATPATAPAIRAFIDKVQIPFLVTPKAKGIAREDHPLFLGVASGMAIDRDIVETIRSADLVLAIGFDPVECDKTWFANVDVVSIDSASMAEGDYYPLEAIGDIASLLGLLSAEPKPWPAELLERRRKAIQRVPIDGGNGLSPLRLIEELRSVFPRDGIATCDVGSHKLVMGQFWRSYEPGTFFMSNGLSGMGFGLPAAIAAQLVHRDKAVIAVVGDGGMLMMVHDLVLIRELGLPIVMVVLSDRSLSLIRVSEERRGIAPYGVDFSPPDFAAIAAAFGIRSRRVANIAEVRACLEQALTDRIPFLIDVSIDYREYYDLI